MKCASEALRVVTSLYQAAQHFRDYRLPELFWRVCSGAKMTPRCITRCLRSPQAFASGAMFLMLTSILGIRPSAPRKELNIINPELPEWLDHLHIRNLRVGTVLALVSTSRARASAHSATSWMSRAKSCW